MKAATIMRIARAGSVRARRRALTSGLGARRLAATAAALRLGVLDALDAKPRSTRELASQLADSQPDAAQVPAGGPGVHRVDADPVSDLDRVAMLDAFLHVLAGEGLLRGGDREWRLTRLGHALVADDTARAMFEAFDGYHTGLYRELDEPLFRAVPRRDTQDQADLVARLSRLLEPLILDELTKALSEGGAGRVLDIGCGSGALLVHMLQAAPGARGVGVDVASEAVAQTARACARAGVGHRVDLATGDATQVLTGTDLVPEGSLDLAVAANVVYYLDPAALAGLLEVVAARLRPGGVLVVITTDLDESVISRHLDLLLRTQSPAMALVGRDALVAALTSAGLQISRVKRLAPGDPLIAVHARRPVVLAM
ncbi:MAG: SAM-dependent methyltransferase [Actinomycetales bacterium]